MPKQEPLVIISFEETNVISMVDWKKLNPANPPRRLTHLWRPTTLNHGETQCMNCLMTNREATVLGPYCIAE